MSLEGVVRAVAPIADADIRDDGEVVIVGLAPDSDGDTSPGGAWDEECHALQRDVQGRLPSGWEAHWRDDDLVVVQSHDPAVLGEGPEADPDLPYCD